MKREVIENAVKACEQNASKDVYHWELAGEVSEKRLSRAISSFAPEVRIQEVVALFDTSISQSGRSGFLITETRIYGKDLKLPFLELDELSAVLPTRGKVSVMLLCYRDGSVYDGGIGENHSLNNLYPLFQLLLGNAGEEPPKKETYEEFHRLYGEELRRRMEAAVDVCRIDGLWLAKSVPASSLSNAIESFAPDASMEECIAFEKEYPNDGKKGCLLTEHALYEVWGEPIYFDGLVRLCRGKRSGESFLLYENGYAKKLPFLRSDGYRELIQAVLEAYQALHREIEEKGAHASGLSAIAGWEEFLKHRGEGSLDTCRNSVFVSSTFKDMHFERDIIHDLVLPRLNQAGEEYGQTVSFCDLRWGVNTGDLDNEEGSRKVLSVCLNEIERCKPYMLVILGERYGWIPEPSVIENALEGRPDFVLDELEKSVTALEIEFGALAKSRQLDRTFFYFREMEGNLSEIYKSEDERHAHKLEKLKKRIKKLAKGHIRTYQLSWPKGGKQPLGLKEFAGLVTEDLLGAMKEEWISHAGMTEWERERELQWELAKKKALQCSARDSFILSCMEDLNKGESPVAVIGAPGSGKSTVMGCLAVALSLSGARVLPVFGGYTRLSDTAAEVAEALGHFLEEHLNPGKEKASETEENGDWIERMNQLALRYEREGKDTLVLVLDAVDQLAVDELRDKLKFLPEKGLKKVRVIFSCVEDFELPYLSCKRRLPVLKKEDCPAVIEGILRLHHRELEAPVIAAAAGKAAAEHPLYLSVLIQRLLMMNKNDFDHITRDGDGMTAITRHQLELIAGSSETLSGISRELLDAAAERLGGDFVRTAMNYLAASRRGLRETDLEGLLKEQGISWSSLDFSLFINYLRSMFTLRADGRYDFSHKSFREGLREALGGEAVHGLHVRIAEWLVRLPGGDPLRSQELWYHCLEAGCWKLLKGFFETMEARTEEERRVMARELAVFSRRDEGRLLVRLIEEEKEALSHEFLHFLCCDWHHELLGEKNCEELKERVFEACLSETEKAAGEAGDGRLGRDASVLRSRLGVLYRNKGEYSRALSYFEEVLKKEEELEKECSSEENRRDICVSWDQIGTVREKMGGQENLAKAKECYQKGLELAKALYEETGSAKSREDAGWGYRHLAHVYEKEDNPDKAVEAYEGCIGMWKEASLEAEKKRLCRAYRDIGYLYHCLNPADEEKAMEYFGYARDLWKEIVRDNPSVQNLEDQAVNFMDMGHAGCERGEAFWEETLENYEKAVRVLKVTDPEFYTWSIASACEKMAKILYEKNKSEKSVSVQVRIEELSGEAIELYEDLVRRDGSVDAYMDLSRILVYTNMWTENADRETDCLEREIEVCEILYEKTHDNDYRKQLKETKRVLKLHRMLKW